VRQCFIDTARGLFILLADYRKFGQNLVSFWVSMMDICGANVNTPLSAPHRKIVDNPLCGKRAFLQRIKSTLLLYNTNPLKRTLIHNLYTSSSSVWFEFLYPALRQTFDTAAS
jgi:hypothetical protein